MLDRTLNEMVSIPEGEKSLKMPLLQALIYSHARKKMNDTRSANLILGALQKAGDLE